MKIREWLLRMNGMGDNVIMREQEESLQIDIRERVTKDPLQ